MASNEPEAPVMIALTDIVFECPVCGKSMVIDEVAEGMTVDCPQCQAKVIVPARPLPSASNE